MANTNRTQLALAASAHFRQRVKGALVKIAGLVLDEAPGTANHAARVAYARTVLRDPDQAVGNLISGFVFRPNVFNFDTAYDFTAGTFGEIVSATGDLDLESQIATDFDRLAGVA